MAIGAAPLHSGPVQYGQLKEIGHRNIIADGTAGGLTDGLPEDKVVTAIADVPVTRLLMQAAAIGQSAASQTVSIPEHGFTQTATVDARNQRVSLDTDHNGCHQSITAPLTADGAVDVKASVEEWIIPGQSAVPAHQFFMPDRP